MTAAVAADFSDTLAQAVARSEAELTATQEGYTAAQGEAARVGTRLAGLQNELDAIQKRRLDGQTRADDAARVELLRLDIQGLQTLADKAAAAVESARKEVDSAQAAVQYAQQSWQRHQASTAAIALEVRLREIERTLTQGIGRLAELRRQAEPGKFIAGSQIFRPGPELNRFLQHGVIPPAGG